ncbi:MAG: bifunctional glutamate N-acetyltransferase/amino-acid acetyltransferase ArgJ [Candidatus Omnitrophota bacterium]
MVKGVLPLGYKANGLACGIKKSGKFDLGLIFSQEPAGAIGLFTANKIISGSVRLSQIHLKKSYPFRAIIINSGNANCFTPIEKATQKIKKQELTEKGSLRSAQQVVNNLSQLLRIEKHQILFASTGIIGQALPVNRIKKAAPELVKGLSQSGLGKAAEAIMTTDTFTKVSTAAINIGRKLVTVCGLAKGAGMIAPNLIPKATMLGFILSDADITPRALRLAFKKAVDNSFNCITVDGCMSTNDSVFLISNSCANNPRIHPGSRDFNKFSSALNYVCLDLAKMIVKDAEGSSKFIQINVKQAKNFKEAKRAALSVANSNLFKTAMFGRSRNFGRIVAALGASGVDVKEECLKIKVSPLKKPEICVEIMLGMGKCEASVYTSDLTPEYIKINAEYS